jgi:glutamate formiminotransferase
MPLIECVPNVSEGRRPDVIKALAAALIVPGIRLLDQSSDPSHNRTVYTFIGEPEQVQHAAIQLYEAAIERIDLRQHEGVHPRIGVVDVFPFVPMAGTGMAACVALSRSTAELVATRFQVPVYLYEDAARRPERRNLADIRRGGLGDLERRIGEVAWLPDFGRPTLHPTAGATAIGARPILIAYNVNLASDRVDIARRIALAVRESGGGFAAVKAMGVRLEERGIVQVSMNLSDSRRTSMTTVFDAISREAAIDGVEVLESEIVGLLPADALPPDAATRLKLRNEDAGKTIESRM